MGQELRIDTMNWAKIYKSAERSNKGSHLPKLGQDGPAHGSTEPPSQPFDPGLCLDGLDQLPMTVGGYFQPFQPSQLSLGGYIRSSLFPFQHTLQARALSYSLKTIPTVTTVIGRLYKELTLSISTHTSSKSSLIFSQV